MLQQASATIDFASAKVDSAQAGIQEGEFASVVLAFGQHFSSSSPPPLILMHIGRMPVLQSI
jgi:hypothetical protein